jgi:putative phosphoesterase
LKVGIISDTHKKLGRAKKGIDLLLDEGAEYIIHAGDIVRKEVLDYLKERDVIYLAVYGNNDMGLYQYHNEYNLVQEPYYFKIKEIRFKLMHYPYYMTKDVDVIIYGHTHIFHSQIYDNTLFINPGELCARDNPKSKVALLEIKNDKYIVNSFSRELKTEEWKKTIFEYERKQKSESKS